MGIVIDIDIDKPCSLCGKAGATPSGVCLACAADMLTVEGKTMVMDKTITECGALVAGLMRDYSEEIIDAIQDADTGDAEDGKPKLNVSFGIVLEPKPEGAVNVTATMSFTAKEIKDRAVSLVEELQGDMFEEPAGAEAEE